MVHAHHGHVTLSKVHKSHNFPTPQRLHLLPSRESLCIVAELPKVLKSKKGKNQAAFLNRLVGGLLFGLVEFPGTCERCRPSLNALIEPASAKEC